MGPLNDLRVLELGTLIAGPFCGQLFGDMGADVIKIEPPGIGDPMRSWGRGLAVWWPIIGRNKRCITLNLRERAGQEILKNLISQSDILIENFRPGTMEKWGLGYDILSAINSQLIMVRVSGFGQSGPYSSRAGYGSIGEAMGGIRHITGDPEHPPSRVGISIGDSLAATFACLGALAALHARENTGRGQIVDSAIYESVLAVMESTIPEFTEGGTIRERSGAILPKTAPSNVYPSKDGEMIVIGANQDSVFSRLAEAMEQPALSTDANYADHISRGENQLELDNRIAEWSVQLVAEDLLRVLEQHGVPAGRIFRVPDMLENPHFQARNSIVDVVHPTYKNLKMQNVFPRMSDTQGEIRWPGPKLGQHNAEVYGELLGMSSDLIDEYKSKGLV